MSNRLSVLLAVTAVWICAPAASGQQQTQSGGNVGTSTNVGGTRSPRPSIGNNEPDLSTQRPIFISGKVVLDDGSTALEPIKIERICGNSPRTEGFTDRKGRFSFELGRNQEFQDASENSLDPFSGATSVRRAGPVA